MSSRGPLLRPTRGLNRGHDVTLAARREGRVKRAIKRKMTEREWESLWQVHNENEHKKTKRMNTEERYTRERERERERVGGGGVAR